ncbi:3-methyl-2-oxobutanoate hydroxymethyltransferase [Calycomorphotria hydatis]|uniref:3-methyl-2-oxobutanoate hydroxymethyltransferase n=1 Tax=Calycomorphotria hydatis TaxID=2528027 RepID=A0A517T9C9_9PLAN|nr:3-methyl-2-oxobutanoate hydroxymethyltransferase [Calycomorphotria hydatis]QDT64968.1 3-methyl-2-oxobutanoate hydroxymethyltransferase [Calycomorphotria hydatis]
MSSKPSPSNRPMTVPGFAACKGDRKLSVLTAYDFPTAKMLDEAGVDAILVGDTLGMVVQGKSTTLPVTMDQMIYHCEMVARAAKRALVICDLPFMSYQASAEQAMENAGRVLKETLASAVKLEGGIDQAETIAAITKAGIPVMGHVGLRPQAVHALGGMNRIQRERNSVIEDALAAESAGAFAIVLELIPRSLAAEITERLSIPTIGIGAGPDCDGQVLVGSDMLGITGFQPKFLKTYADLQSTIKDAVKAYVEDVRSGEFPSDEHSHE